jgi:PhnB protein
MTQINAYLRFNGNCRQAMTFYKECLGGELNMQTVGESPIANQSPREAHNNIMHSTLMKEGWTLLGSDMMNAGDRINGNAIDLAINCSSEEEIQTFFSKLSAGGQVSYPLHKEFWGGMFGMLTDKFGNGWMLNYEKPKA